MQRFHIRRPSGGMAVAFVALLAALSGTAVALPGKNTVNSGDIKNGQVKSADIKNNSVVGKDIKNNSVRGKDIRSNTVRGSDISESSLGTVPTANTASNAQSLGGTSADAIKGAISKTLPFSFRLGDGASKTIVSYAGLVLNANCQIDDGANDDATLSVTTTANNASVESHSDFGDELADLDVADSPAVIQTAIAASGTAYLESGDEDAFAVAADQKGLVITQAIGFNLGGSTGTCSFMGSVGLIP